MLKYTFSSREKALIVVLAVILLAFAWYQFVWVGVQSQIATLTTQISDEQTQYSVDTAKLSRMTSMESSIKQYQADGLVKRSMPTYDNIQNVMWFLSATLTPTTSYQLTFDAIDTSTAGVVKRGVTITFGCDSYASAKAVLSNLVNGSYPAELTKVMITDNSAAKTSTGVVGTGSTSATASASFSVQAHVTFYEKSA